MLLLALSIWTEWALFVELWYLLLRRLLYRPTGQSRRTLRLVIRSPKYPTIVVVVAIAIADADADALDV